MTNASFITRRDHDGFSLVELMIAMLIISIIGGMTVVSVQAGLTNAKGDTAAAQVASALRYARDAAIAQRRRIDVVPVMPNRLQLNRNEPNGTQTTILEIALENGAQFQADTSLPDTPDGFGHNTPFSFQGAATIRFIPDGTLTDVAGVPVNGTISTKLPAYPMSARTITVTGTTGRAQPYRWTGSRWEAL